MKLTKAQRETAKSNNIPLDRAHKRIDYGWDVETAITKPLRKKNRGGMWAGNTYITPEQINVAEDNDISRGAIYQRIKRGHTVEQAITTQKFKYREDLRKYTNEELELAKRNGISINTVRVRISSGWDRRRALTEPLHTSRINGTAVNSKVTKEQKEYANLNGISTSLLNGRINSGWTVEDAINRPPRQYYGDNPGDRLAYGVNVTKSQIETAEENGVGWETLKKRIKYGMSVEEAINKPLAFKKRTFASKERDETLEMLGRIKYLNRHDFKDDPIAFPKTELRKIEAMGLSINDVKEIEA